MKAVKPTKKWLYSLALLPAIVGICAYLGWNWWLRESAPLSSASESTTSADKAVQVKIKPGMSSQQIGEQLQAAGLIRDRQAWKLWAHWLSWHDKHGEFKTGVYKLSPTQSLPAIADTIWHGKVIQLSFTIPEGWSLKQMAEYFQAQGFFKADDFLAAARKIPKDKYPWLPDGLSNLEGFLYPDTYKLASDDVTPDAAVKQMLGRFEKLALPIYKEAPNHTKMNLLQWVTLASIVEKEAVVANERPRIAGVFLARLQKRITLGSDPTVEYGLGIRQTADRPLTIAEVKTPNPYNTYINQGLPPGPISSPGLGSLKGVLYPENTDYLYFVARYDGTHVFSRTLQEHTTATNAIRSQRRAR